MSWSECGLGGMTIGKEAQMVIAIEENAALFTLS